MRNILKISTTYRKTLVYVDTNFQFNFSQQQPYFYDDENRLAGL